MVPQPLPSPIRRGSSAFWAGLGSWTPRDSFVTSHDGLIRTQSITSSIGSGHSALGFTTLGTRARDVTWCPRCISSNAETKVTRPGSWQRRSPRCAVIFVMSLGTSLLLCTGLAVRRIFALPRAPFASHKLCGPRGEDTAGDSPRPRILRLFSRRFNPAARELFNHEHRRVDHRIAAYARYESVRNRVGERHYDYR